MQIIKKLLYVYFIFSSQIFFAMTEQAGNVSQAFVGVAEYLPGAQEVIPYAGVASQIYWVGKDMKSYCFPNKGELARAIEVDEQLFAMKTKKELRSCLLNNSSTQHRQISGRPTACQDLAEKLIQCGGKNDVDIMTAVFNQNIK